MMHGGRIGNRLFSFVIGRGLTSKAGYTGGVCEGYQGIKHLSGGVCEGYSLIKSNLDGGILEGYSAISSEHGGICET